MATPASPLKEWYRTCIDIEGIKNRQQNILGCEGFLLIAQLLHNKQLMNSHHNCNMELSTFLDQKIRKQGRILTPYNENLTMARKIVLTIPKTNLKS